jgi:hypothetical protein
MTSLQIQERSRKAKDLTGSTFGFWTVLEPIKLVQSGRRRTAWKCQCSCGTERVIEASTLTRDRSRSCGCTKITHGMSRGGKHPLYVSWTGAWQRCTNPNSRGWKNYGGRGVEVCAAWRSFTVFLRDMQPSWRKGLTLDRIDTNGHYSPDNCRWVDRKAQSVNRRHVTIVDVDGVSMSLREAAQHYGAVDYTTVRYRLSRGWDLHIALTTPPNHKPSKGTP